ncbi:MAG: YceI family protein [Bacteroidota bacterium]
MKWKSVHIFLLIIGSLFILSKSYGDENALFCSLQAISIEGRTNVNQFEFLYDSSNVKRRQSCGKNQDGSYSGTTATFKLPVKAFDSKNKKMNRDFYTMLEASEYPEIIVEIEKSKLQKMIDGELLSSIKLDLTIAGNTRTVNSNCSYLTEHSGDKIILKGKTKINLKDFSLSPPEKMLGLIHVNKTILINFEVALNNT